MNAYRLSAAGGALALHGIVLTGVLSLALAPPAHREIEPVQVVLITPPEPLPVAPAPREPVPAPHPVDPTPQVRAPAPAPPAPRKPVLAKPAPPKPTPRPVARPSPPRPAPAPEPAAQAIALPPAGATSEAAPPAAEQAPPSPPAAVAATRDDAATQTAAPRRNPPRVDASWSGNTPPPYPGVARRMGDQGEVRLDVRVDVDGKVTEIRLKQSSGSALLDRTAVDTVKKWRFKPATVDGQPVAEWYHDWRWVFRLEG
jgi:protein TonB